MSSWTHSLTSWLHRSIALSLPRVPRVHARARALVLNALQPTVYSQSIYSLQSSVSLSVRSVPSETLASSVCEQADFRYNNGTSYTPNVDAWTQRDGTPGPSQAIAPRHPRHPRSAS